MSTENLLAVKWDWRWALKWEGFESMQKGVQKWVDNTIPIEKLPPPGLVRSQ